MSSHSIDIFRDVGCSGVAREPGERSAGFGTERVVGNGGASPGEEACWAGIGRVAIFVRRREGGLSARQL